MGKLITNTSKKLLRYGNFANSITKSYVTDYDGYRTSYVDQNFLGSTCRLFEVSGGDSNSRTSYISYDYMNGERYNDKYNLKYHSNEGYWGSGTIKYTSDYLIKEENVFPNNYLDNSGYVEINIPSTCVNQLLSTGINVFVTLDSDILGYNIYSHYNVDVDWPSGIWPYSDMSTDYEFYYKFNRSIDYNKNLRFKIEPPSKYNYYANVFIYIPNWDDITCNITYNSGSMNGYDEHEYDVNFLYTELYDQDNDLLSSGVGYSFHVDGIESKAHQYEWCGNADITVTNVS